MTTLPTAGKPIYYRDFIIVPVFILLQYTFPLLAEEVFPNLLKRLLIIRYNHQATTFFLM